ncbi:MAG: class I SAM-dependent methyltransferase [Planctomycetes bacterium]|nr:class I SAM-dependent methyltransferase [Planctomycetota bacterium]
MNHAKKPKLTKTVWGFYQYTPLPSDEELNDYYANKYYQEGIGSYSVSYTEEEISYLRLKASLIYRKTAQLTNGSMKGKTLVDIGCGEGWVMNEFYRQGVTVLGIDFSRHGIEKFHPHLIPFLEQGNLYELVEEKVRSESQFDFLMVANVIEHVIDPILLLNRIKRMMHHESILVIVAPNDFSPLHELLLKEKNITRKFWLCYPDHLSYFDKASMCSFLNAHGFEVRTILADNPIDLNLLNDNSNYIEDPTKGKNTHLFRVRTDNFLGSLDAEKLIQVYELLGSIGVGRDLNYYCSLAK